jgi:tetratricopeptide (TPR) repeat protein
MFLKNLRFFAVNVCSLVCLLTLSAANQVALGQSVAITDPADAKELQEAVKFEAQGHMEAAQPIAQRLVKKYPKCSLPWKLLGSCLFFSFQISHSPNEALFCAERALTLAPDDSSAYQLMADIENESGHFGRAAMYATKGLQYKPVDVKNYRSRSSALTNLHKPEEALADYSKYLELSPHLAVNRRNRLSKATLCESAGHLQEALDIYVKLQKEEYGDTIPPLQAAILVKLHKNDEALQVLNELIKKVPGDEMAFVARAHLWETLGRLPAAVNDYSSAIAIDGQANFYLSRASLYDKLGRKEQAALDRKSASKVDSY